MRVAIVDLGSNTFHILISELDDQGKLVEVFRERVFVGLSEGGGSTIKPEIVELGLSTCNRFHQSIMSFGVDKVKVVGTAVLRSASNSVEFVAPCEKIFDTHIELIGGDREAELIYKGVSLLGIPMQNSLIMDIGGGSVEFIIVQGRDMVWCRSFPIGVGVLHALFHHNEPILPNSIIKAEGYVRTVLAPLIDALGHYQVNELIGASGSFEVVKDVFDYEHNDLVFEVDIKDLRSLSKKIIGSDYQERLAIDGIPEQRAKLIVVAMILINVTLEIAKPNILTVSPFAIKEGILAELFELS